MTPGGNPVTDVPGETPTSPVMALTPVFVTVEPPRTAKVLELPRDIWPDAGEDARTRAAIPMTARKPSRVRFMVDSSFRLRRFPAAFSSADDSSRPRF
jgi:hypothetical protein